MRAVRQAKNMLAATLLLLSASFVTYLGEKIPLFSSLFQEGIQIQARAVLLISGFEASYVFKLQILNAKSSSSVSHWTENLKALHLTCNKKKKKHHNETLCTHSLCEA